MESLIIPGIIGGIIGIFFLTVYLLTRYCHFCKGDDTLVIIGAVFLLEAFVLALIACPLIRNVESQSDAITAETYYTNIIEPHIISEFPDYVVVDSSVAPAIWQSGDYNLADYNSYLATMRYWDSVPIIGSVIYPPPSNLKFVKVENEEVNNV